MRPLSNHALQGLYIKDFVFINFIVTPNVTPFKSVLPLVRHKKTRR